MNLGDLVIIKDEQSPIIYIIEEIINDDVYLKGSNYRIRLIKKKEELILAPINIVKKEQEKNDKYIKKIKTQQLPRTSKKPMFGRILHIDGDPKYLDSCMNLYKEMGIYAEGIYIKEKEVKNKIEKIITQTTPDIIVITGHDIYNGKGKHDLSNYENTSHFIDALRIIRKRYYQDQVTVIIGACCSNFEALIGNGANFASSPSRINIHTYDPAVIAIKVASTSIDRFVDFDSCVKLIENGKRAFGGVETKGKMKLLL